MSKATYKVRCQAYYECPSCGHATHEDVDWDEELDGLDMVCDICGHEFELDNREVV